MVAHQRSCMQKKKNENKSTVCLILFKYAVQESLVEIWKSAISVLLQRSNQNPSIYCTPDLPSGLETHWSCWCFLESADDYRTKPWPPLDRNSAPWRSLWFPDRSEGSFSQSKCWGPRWPAVWSWFFVCVSWMVPRRQTPSGFADPSDSRAQLQPASAPARVSTSGHFLEWCPASQTCR